MLRTRGMPMRRSDRRFEAVEGLVANQFSHVGMRTSALLQSGFDQPHLVDVFQQSLRAGVSADHALPALLQRDLAPRTAYRSGQLYVDEGALAVATAPVTNGVVARRAAVGQRLDDFESAEPARRSGLQPLPRAQRRADRPGLARIGMNDNLRVGYLRLDEVDLRLDHGQVAMRAALQHEFTADRAQILQLSGVDPDVDWQNRRQRSHDLVRRPTLALLIDDVRLKKDAASHGERRHGLRRKRSLRVSLQRYAVALGDALQECSIAR